MLAATGHVCCEYFNCKVPSVQLGCIEDLTTLVVTCRTSTTSWAQLQSTSAPSNKTSEPLPKAFTASELREALREPRMQGRKQPWALLSFNFSEHFTNRPYKREKVEWHHVRPGQRFAGTALVP